MQQQEASTDTHESSAVNLTELKEQVVEKGRGLASQARQAAESQKERLAEGATGVADALHHASEGLRADEQETVGKYTEALALRVEKVADFLQSSDLPSMAKEVSVFARRQPALFLGGAFTLGIVAARFLKSAGTEPNRGARPNPDDFGPAPGDYADPSQSAEQEAEEARPDPAVSSPGGVPPLPSAQGGL